MSEENQVPAEEVQNETPAQEAPQTEETVVETPVAAATEEVAEEAVPEAPAAAVTEEVTEEVVPEAPAFSWADVEGGSDADSGERQALVDLYAETLGSSVEHQVVEGKVTVKTDREVIIDINSKSEGVVSLNEFRYNPSASVIIRDSKPCFTMLECPRVLPFHGVHEVEKGYLQATLTIAFL